MSEEVVTDGQWYYPFGSVWEYVVNLRTWVGVYLLLVDLEDLLLLDCSKVSNTITFFTRDYE